MTHSKPHHAHQKLNGEFLHFIFSPKGEIEGLLLKIDGKPAQVVVDPKRPELQIPMALNAGQKIELEVVARKPSPKGEAVHALHDLHKLCSIDGHAPTHAHQPKTFSGTVARFNFAKHGVPNGVVLDNGDFIHLKPEGMAASALKIGDGVTARGDARPLSLGSGHAVEARELNGRKLKHEKAHA